MPTKDSTKDDTTTEINYRRTGDYLTVTIPLKPKATKKDVTDMIKKISQLVLTIVVAIGLFGCAANTSVAPVQAGNDPVVVHAEQVYQESFDTFNTLYLLDDLNKTVVPADVHMAIHNMKPVSKVALENLHQAINTYKHNRTSTNKATITTYLDVLAKEVELANTYKAEIK